MKIKKTLIKYLCCCMLIFVLATFCGCAEINYSTIKNENGQITETVTAIVDEEAWTEQGYNITTKKQEVINIAKRAMQAKYNEYIMLCNTEKTRHEFAQNYDIASIYSELLTSVVMYEPYFDGDVFFTKIEFASSTAYYLFYDLTEQNFTEAETNENFFTYTTYFRGNLGYSVNNGLYATLKADLQNIFPEFSEENASLIYSYLTTARRYHSNADTVTYTDQGYLHSWNVDSDNLDEEIYFYLIRANRYAWYLTAIIISLTLAIVLVLIGTVITIVKNKHRKKEIAQEIQN